MLFDIMNDDEAQDVVHRLIRKSQTIIDDEDVCTKFWDGTACLLEEIEKHPDDPKTKINKESLSGFLGTFFNIERLELPPSIACHFVETNVAEIHCCIDEGSPYRVVLWEPKFVAREFMKQRSWKRPYRHKARTRVVRVVWNNLIHRDIKAARDAYFTMMDKGINAYIPVKGDRWRRVRVFPENAEELVFPVPVSKDELSWESDPTQYEGLTVKEVWEGISKIKDDLADRGIVAPGNARLVGEGAS